MPTALQAGKHLRVEEVLCGLPRVTIFTIAIQVMWASVIPRLRLKCISPYQVTIFWLRAIIFSQPLLPVGREGECSTVQNVQPSVLEWSTTELLAARLIVILQEQPHGI